MSWADAVKWIRSGESGDGPSLRCAGARCESRAVVELRPGEPRVIKARGGAALVRCAEGIVWLTREGDAEDHILRAGQERRIAGRGRIIGQALSGAARVEVA